MDLFFRISEAARELSTTPNAIRRLVDAGLLKAEFTAGQHMRISSGEVARLKQQGTPSAPRPLPPDKETAEAEDGDTRPVSRCPGAATPSSVEAAESAPDVVRAAEVVRVLQHAERAGELNQRLEEQQDWWRERKRRETEEQERQEALRRDQEAARRCQARRELWLLYALQRIPAEAPAELRNIVYKNVEDLLSSLNPPPGDEVTLRLVEAEVQKHLRPWSRSAEREAAVRAAADRLPARAKNQVMLTKWEARAIQSAREAVGALSESADKAEVDAAAKLAVDQIAAEFAAEEQRAEVIGWASVKARVLPLTERESEAARKAIRDAVSNLPPTTSRSEMESAADEVMAPYRRAVEQRRAEEHDRATRESLIRIAEISLLGMPRKKREKAIASVVEALAKLPAGTPQSRLQEVCDLTLRPHLRKAELIRAALSEIYPWLVKHESQLDLEGRPLTTVERELGGDLETVLEAQLNGSESDDRATKFARRWLREEFRL